MPNASQVSDPGRVVIHANEFGLYSEHTVKGLIQADNIIRLAPLESSF